MFEILGPLEEEDEAIDLGFDGGDELIVVHAVDFLNLGGGDPKLVDELGEDSGVRLDGAPLVEHGCVR